MKAYQHITCGHRAVIKPSPIGGFMVQVDDLELGHYQTADAAVSDFRSGHIASVVGSDKPVLFDSKLMDFPESICGWEVVTLPNGGAF